MRVVVGWQGSDRSAARTNAMSRFETETLTQEDNLKGLALMNPQWVELGHGSHSTPASDSGHGQFGESSAWSAGRSRLQRALRVCLLSSPLSVQPVWGLRRSDATTGNVHSADGWQELLEPVVKGYQKKGLRLLFRGDAAFAKPELYEYLEQGKIGYAIRLPANQVIQEQIQPLLERPTEWPSREPIVSYHDFAYQAQSWHLPRRVVAKVEWHQGELFPRVGFIVTNLSYPPKGIVRFYNGRGTAEQWIKEGKYALHWTRLSCHKFVGQPGETMAVRPDLQPGQLYEKAGVAGGYEALDSDQSSDQADQDGWATGTPRKEAGVSACRGAGNQGNADRDTRTDQPASAGTWLACFESTGISDSYGVVRGK